MDCKIIKFILFLILPFNSYATEFQGSFKQGSFILGKAKPNSKIQIDNKNSVTDESALFLNNNKKVKFEDLGPKDDSSVDYPDYAHSLVNNINKAQMQIGAFQTNIHQLLHHISPQRIRSLIFPLGCPIDNVILLKHFYEISNGCLDKNH